MTTTIIKIAFFILTFTSIEAYSQKKQNPPVDPDEKYARKLIQQILADTLKTDLPRFVLKDTSQVIKIVEQILFPIYGEEHIKAERPYKVYKIYNYWVLLGTCKTKFGGSFEIILNAYDSRVISLSHGK